MARPMTAYTEVHETELRRDDSAAAFQAYGILLFAFTIAPIIAGIIVFLKPSVGGYIVSLWLLGIIVNLLLLRNFYDIALRDLGLLLGALALARLGTHFGR